MRIFKFRTKTKYAQFDWKIETGSSIKAVVLTEVVEEMDAINQGMLFFVSAYQSSDLFKIIAYIVIVNRINFNSKGVLY